MAKINAVTIQTLRLYDREGLLKPLVVDENTGYRYYHINQSARLDMIQYMKDYGLTLRKIKEHIEHQDVEATVEFLKMRCIEIDQQIENLKYNQKEISRAVENYQRYENLPKNHQIFIEYIGERYIFKHRSEKNDELTLAERLIAETEKRDLDIVGDYICEVITEFPAFRENVRDMFFKIQILIRFR